MSSHDREIRKRIQRRLAQMDRDRLRSRMIMANARAQYDEQGRMPFGQHMFERFEDVPTDYLCWLRGEARADWTLYPNLKRYIDASKERLDAYESGR